MKGNKILFVLLILITPLTGLEAKVKTLSETMRALKDALQEIHTENKEITKKVAAMETKLETILSYTQKHTSK